MTEAMWQRRRSPCSRCESSCAKTAVCSRALSCSSAGSVKSTLGTRVDGNAKALTNRPPGTGMRSRCGRRARWVITDPRAQDEHEHREPGVRAGGDDDEDGT